MILTVTINPLLERRLVINELRPGTEHRAANEYFSAGGKGINVSRQLSCLDVNTLALTFLGGNNGKILRNLLGNEQLNFTAISTKNETRHATLVYEENQGRLSTFFGLNSEISQAEANELKLKLRKMIENCEIVVFSGSSPSNLADDIFPYGIETAHEFDKISICDTYGSHLTECIRKAPTIIHNNMTETAKSLNISLESEQEIMSYLGYLYDSGVKQAYLTDGMNPVYASNFDFIYKAGVPEIREMDATGSGDAFTAGIAYGLHNSLTFEDTLSTAVSLGALNASSLEICRTQVDSIREMKSKVRITTLGKRMKTLDNTPTGE
ncbi:MAG: 1-phosphofructokinase family hexose kinase [Ignavibacteriales bacterium]